MINVPSQARLLFQAIVVTVSGLFIAAAVLFGAIALAFAGLLIGCAGALAGRVKPQPRAAIITLNATRTGRGWSVDPTRH